MYHHHYPQQQQQPIPQQCPWQEYTTSDGKKYYHNAFTNITQWHKPQELIDHENMMRMQQTQVAPVATTPTTAQMMMNNPWTEHADVQTGKTYYYNAMTGVSTWTIPPEYSDFLNRQQQLSMSTTTTTTAAASASASEPSSSSSSVITNHSSSSLLAAPGTTPTKSIATTTTPAKSKNGQATTTTIHAPSASAVMTLEPKKPQSTTTTSSTATTASANEQKLQESSSSSPPRILDSSSSQQPPPSQQQQQYKTKEDAIRAFKQLLSDTGVGVGWDWQSAMKKIIHDPRYRSLGKVSEKQQIFHQFVDEKKQRDRDERQSRFKIMQDDFNALLSEMLSNTPKSGVMSYRHFSSLAMNDARFYRVQDELDRQRFFDEYMSKLRKKEKEEYEQRMKQYMDELRKLILQKVDENLITSQSSSRKMDELFSQEECYMKLHRNDRFYVWDHAMPEIEQREHAKRVMERQARKQREKEDRALFHELLLKLKNEKKVNVLSRWQEVEPIIRNESIYQVMQDVHLIKPKDLFESFLDELELEYKENKKILRSILKDVNYEVKLRESNGDNDDEGYSEFYQVVNKDERTQTIDSQNLKILFEELIDQAKRKEKRKRKLAAKFFDMLRSLGLVRPDSTLDQIAPLVQEKEPWLKIKTDQERQNLFADYINSLTSNNTAETADGKELQNKRERPADIQNGEAESEAKRARIDLEPREDSSVQAE